MKSGTLKKKETNNNNEKKEEAVKDKEKTDKAAFIESLPTIAIAEVEKHQSKDDLKFEQTK